MRKVLMIVLGLSLISFPVWAMRTKRPPPFTDLEDPNQLTELNNFLADTWNLTNGRYTLENIIVDPNGVRKGVKGDMVYATFGGNDHVCVATAFPIGTTWTCIDVGTLAVCPSGADGQIMFNDNGSCGSDPNFIYEKNTNHLALTSLTVPIIDTAATFLIDELKDGDLIGLRLVNDFTNVAGSTDETIQIRFGQGSDIDTARIISGKRLDFTSSSNSDSFISFNIDVDGTSKEAMRITGASLDSPLFLTDSYGVSIGYTGTPNASLEVHPVNSTVNGSAILTKDYTNTYSMFNSRGDSYVVVGDTTNTAAQGLIVQAGGRSTITVQGETSSSPVGVTLTSTTGSDDFTSSIQLSDAVSPNRSRTVTWDNSDVTLMEVESPLISFGSDTSTQQILTLTSGLTLSNQRAFIFYPQIINGVAGGSAETVTNAATVYVKNSPSGSNINISNPYALWVDDGVARFDGGIETTATVTTSGILVVSSGMTVSGTVVTNSTITSTSSTDLGWSITTGANTACNTTCIFACVHGWDTAAGEVAVACTDGTADKCLCAGAN